MNLRKTPLRGVHELDDFDVVARAPKTEPLADLKRRIDHAWDRYDAMQSAANDARDTATNLEIELINACRAAMMPTPPVLAHAADVARDLTGSATACLDELGQLRREGVQDGDDVTRDRAIAAIRDIQAACLEALGEA